MLNPVSIKHHKHRHALSRILDQLDRFCRENTEVHLYKVKAHGGVIGNEAADAVAKAAAMTQSGHPFGMHAEDDPFHGAPWWHCDQTGELRPLNDLKSSLKHHMHEKHRLGSCNQQTTCYTQLVELSSHISPKHAAYLMTSSTITTPMLRCILQYRTDTIITQKWRNRFTGTQGPAQCPLCKGHDSSWHVLSGCSDTSMTNMMTARHNAAGRIILNAVLNGDKGSEVVSYDVGVAHEGDLQVEGASRSIPTWLMPPAPHNPTSRPDITLVSSAQMKVRAGNPRPQLQNTTPGSRQVILVDVKYCHEPNFNATVQAAINQHQDLARYLGAGRCKSVKVLPIILGVGGAIFKEHTEKALSELGISSDESDRVCRLLVRNAAKWALCLTHLKRSLDMAKMGEG